jgi:peroxiredoxin
MISRKEILKVGSNPPEIELPNGEDKYINSKMFEGKLVLLEFWASWCAPCRSMNPELLKVYNEFSRENFEILGISIDKDKKAWKKAIEDDKLEWTQTIDTTRETIKSFKISGIPFNVLLNRNGKIISTDLKPNELRKIIESKI